MKKPGEQVLIEFSSADTQTAAAVTLKDANGATRTLLSTERLLIDTLDATLAAAVVLAEVFSDDGDGNVEASERIAAFGANNGNFRGGAEGYPVEVGVTPSVKGSAAGAVTINGTGRIVLGQSNGRRPSWREDETV